MTIYSSDFSTDTAGAFPAGWAIGAGAATDFVVQDDAAAEGGKVLRISAAGAQKFLTRPEANGALTGEVLIKLRTSNIANESGVVIRQNTTAGYAIHLRSNSGVGYLYITNYGSTGGALATVSSPFTYTANTWYYIRVAHTQSSIKAKVWAASSVEPTTWTRVATGTTGTLPGIGLYHYGASGQYTEFDTVSIDQSPAILRGVYSMDFTHEATGNGIYPAHWTRRQFAINGNYYSVLADASVTSGKVLKAGASSFNESSLTQDEWTGRENVQMTVRVKAAQGPALTGQPGPGVVLDGASYTASSVDYHNGVVVRLWNSNTPSAGVQVECRHGNAIQFTEYVNFDWDTNLYQWIKVRKIGQKIWVKVWNDGTDEPQTWTYSKQNLYIGQTASGYYGVTSKACASDFANIVIEDAPIENSWDEYDANTNMAAWGWTRGAGHTWQTWTTPNDAAATGGRILRGSMSQAGYNGLLVPSVTNTVRDSEVLTKVRINATGSDVGIAMNVTGPTTSSFAAHMAVLNAGAYLRLQTISSGMSSNRASYAYSYTANTWHWIRTKKEGRNFKVRVWADGAAEPSVWHIDWTAGYDAPVGTICPYGYCASSVNLDFDEWHVIEPVDAPPAVHVTMTVENVADSTFDAPAPTINVVAAVNISNEAPLVDFTLAATAPDAVNVAIGTYQEAPVATASLASPTPTIPEPSSGYTDFSNYATNAQPAGWTLYGSGTRLVQDDAAATGGKVLRITVPSVAGNPLHAFTWDLMGSRLDGAFQTNVRTFPVGDGAPNTQARGGVLARLQADGSAYIFGVHDSYADTTLGQWRFNLVKTVGATPTHIAQIQKNGQGRPNLKIETNASQVRVKVWWGNSEPSTWDYTWTDPDPLPAGLFGLAHRVASSFSRSSDFDIGAFGPPVVSLAVDPITLNWQVLPLVTLTRGVLWSVTKEVTKTASLSWDSGTKDAVTASTSLMWDVVGTVTKTASAKWNIVNKVDVSRAVRWNVTAPVAQVSRDLRWRTFNDAGTTTTDLRWGILRPVQTAAQIIWSEQAEIEASTAALRWVTNADDQVVLTSRLISWNSLVTLPQINLGVTWGSALDVGRTDETIIDFTEYPLGALPADWVAANKDPASTSQRDPRLDWTVEARADAIGGRVLRGNYRDATFTYWDLEPSKRDQDVLMRVQSASSLRFYIGAGVSSPHSHYRFDVAKNGGVSITHVSASAVIGSASGAGPAYLSSQWIWVRVQNLMAINTSPYLRQVKAKVWLDGTPEPLNWNASYTDSSSSQIVQGQYYYTVEGNFLLTGVLDVDWIGYVQPNARVVAPTSTIYLESLIPGQGQSISLSPTGPGRVAPRAFPPSVELGDQVLVSWLVFEIPEAVRIVSEIFADPMTSTLSAFAPSLNTQRHHTVEITSVGTVNARAIAPFSVVAQEGAAPQVENAAAVTVGALVPDVAIRASASISSPEATLSTSALTPDLITEFNARIEVPDPSDALFGASKPTRINGNWEIEVGNTATVAFQGIAPAAVIATLTVDAPLAEVSTQALEPTVRLSSRIVVPTSTFIVVGTPVEISRGVGIGVPLATLTVQGSAPSVRMGIRIDWLPSMTQFVGIVPDAVQAYFTIVPVSITVPDPASVSLNALEPEYRYSPAEVGDAVSVYLGQMYGEVRLGRKETDTYLGSTHGDVVLAEVRDEVRA